MTANMWYPRFDFCKFMPEFFIRFVIRLTNFTKFCFLTFLVTHKVIVQISGFNHRR